jgi:hypothetical protein
MSREQLYKALYRTDFASFVPFSFGLLFPGSTFYSAYYIVDIAKRLQRCMVSEDKRLAVTLPPRHLKSFTASIAYPAWLIACNPERRIVVMSGTRSLQSELLTKFMALVAHPKLRSVFPNLKFSKTSRGFKTKQGGAVEFFVVSESMIGKGADVIVIDDPISPTQANDGRKLARLNQWYDENIYQRLNDKREGVIAVVMQRLAVDDLIGHLEKQDEWSFLRYPLIAEENVTRNGKTVQQKFEPLNQNLGVREEYCRAMLRMGARTFMAQYQQKPYPNNEGECRRGIWSSLRKGVPWKVGDEAPRWAFAMAQEHKILLHTVFGLGEHPWPDNMRRDMCAAERILEGGSDEHRYDLIQLMSPEQRKAHGIDPSGNVFPDFTPYLTASDRESDRKSKVYNPDFRPETGRLFRPMMCKVFDEDSGDGEDVYGYDEPLDSGYFNYVDPRQSGWLPGAPSV